VNSSRKYFFNTSWILIEKMSRIISGVLVGVLVARYLGPSQFGIISYSLNVVAIFTVISILGMDSIIVRELVVRSEEKDILLGTAFLMRLAGAVAVICCATLYSSMRDPAATTFIVFLVSIAIAFQSFAVIDFFFQSQVRGKLTAINQVITLSVSSVIKIFLIFSEAPLEWFASMVMLEAFLTALNQVVFYSRENRSVLLWKFSFREAKVLLSHSWPVIISSLMMMLYQKMDQILILRYYDLFAVGNYAAAVRMSEASYFIPVAISAAVFPGIINSRNDSQLQHKRLVQLYSLLIWTAIIISFGGLLVGDQVISFLYKEKFPLSPDVFRIHIWSTLPIFFSTAWGMWMVAENKQHLVIILQLVSLLMCLFFCFLLIPRLGITGAALAIIGTYYSGLVAVLCIYKPQLNFRLFLSAFNPRHIIEIYHYYKNDK
jgi:O-antigen/teichoic acid export membrane protein